MVPGRRRGPIHAVLRVVACRGVPLSERIVDPFAYRRRMALAGCAGARFPSSITHTALMSLRIAWPDSTVPLDAIARANAAFLADRRPDRLNLGIGVYTDAQGAVPLMEAVRLAERQLVETAAPHRYLPIEGLAAYDRCVQALVLGDDEPAIATGRTVTFQTLGGTGALHLAALLLRQSRGDATVLISDPSWDNHRAIFEAAGFPVDTYPYADPVVHAVAFDALIARLARTPAGTIVVLHVCCHNPTGMDLDDVQWDRIVDVVADRGLIPVCDLAYQGFGSGLVGDRQVIRRMVARGLDVLVASSLSKSFALYGDRVGALTVVTSSAGETVKVTARLNRIVRSSYSNPPTHGAAIAATVLSSPALRAVWTAELDGMRRRIEAMRAGLCERLAALAPAHDMSFIASQRGMFSYTGLRADEVATLNVDHAIHLVSTGRLCVAALNDANIDRVASALGAVLAARTRAASGRSPDW